MQQDVDTKRKGSHHITSHLSRWIPQEAPAAEFRREVRQMPIGQVEKNSDALENTEETSVVERFKAGKVEFILGIHGEERRTLQPPGAVLTLKITATNQ